MRGNPDMSLKAVSQAESLPERGLVLLGEHVDTIEATGWPLSFDAVRHEPLEKLAETFDIVVPADHLSAAPLLKAGTRAAFLVHDLDALERLRAMADEGGLPGPILFAPTAVARLELHRLSRPALKAARAIPFGKALEPADIAEEPGGTGIAASLRETILGKTALYELKEGAALDFGVIAEDEWRQP